MSKREILLQMTGEDASNLFKMGEYKLLAQMRHEMWKLLVKEKTIPIPALHFLRFKELADLHPQHEFFKIQRSITYGKDI